MSEKNTEKGLFVFEYDQDKISLEFNGNCMSLTENLIKVLLEQYKNPDEKVRAESIALSFKLTYEAFQKFKDE